MLESVCVSPFSCSFTAFAPYLGRVQRGVENWLKYTKYLPPTHSRISISKSVDFSLFFDQCVSNTLHNIWTANWQFLFADEQKCKFRNAIAHQDTQLTVHHSQPSSFNFSTSLSLAHPFALILMLMFVSIKIFKLKTMMGLWNQTSIRLTDKKI